MRNHAIPRDAKAAAALAHGIRQTDARLHLPPSASAARDLDLDVFDEHQPQSLHECIIVDALAADAGSRCRYMRFETGLLNAYLRQYTGSADPAQRVADLYPCVPARETIVLDLMLSLEDRLHQSVHTQSARLRQAGRQHARRRARHGSR